MATIGKSKAIVSTNSFEIGGLIAWLMWSLVHIIYLIGYRTKILVLVEWTISYVFNKNGPRLIYREVK